MVLLHAVFVAPVLGRLFSEDFLVEVIDVERGDLDAANGESILFILKNSWFAGLGLSILPVLFGLSVHSDVLSCPPV